MRRRFRPSWMGWAARGPCQHALFSPPRIGLTRGLPLDIRPAASGATSENPFRAGGLYMKPYKTDGCNPGEGARGKRAPGWSVVRDNRSAVLLQAANGPGNFRVAKSEQRHFELRLSEKTPHGLLFRPAARGVLGGRGVRFAARRRIDALADANAHATM